MSLAKEVLKNLSEDINEKIVWKQDKDGTYIAKTKKYRLEVLSWNRAMRARVMDLHYKVLSYHDYDYSGTYDVRDLAKKFCELYVYKN